MLAFLLAIWYCGTEPELTIVECLGFFNSVVTSTFCLQGRIEFDLLIINLDREYTAKYGDVLPESGKSRSEL